MARVTVPKAMSLTSPHLSVQGRHNHSPAYQPVLAICWDEALAHHEIQDLRENALFGEEGGERTGKDKCDSKVSIVDPLVIHQSCSIKMGWIPPRTTQESSDRRPSQAFNTLSDS